MEMKGVSENETSVQCSICLDMIINGGLRSLANLQCGHQFHLDCIGSAFNFRGEMQCPNCRVTEEGQWLYARGPTISAPELSMGGTSFDSPTYFVGFPEMVQSFEPLICPYQGLTYEGLTQANRAPLAIPSLSDFELVSSVTPMGNHYSHGWSISSNPAPFHHHQSLAQGLPVPEPVPLSVHAPVPLSMHAPVPLSVHAPVPMPLPIPVTMPVSSVARRRVPMPLPIPAPLPVTMPVSSVARRRFTPRRMPRFMPSQQGEQGGQAYGSIAGDSPNGENPPMNSPPS